uniref:Reverse transcriptase domain-containing protein n=1 Tax=Pygocentrus nattereri TaxID=42514 RepID=A0AAR2IWT2_PYGNA
MGYVPKSDSFPVRVGLRCGTRQGCPLSPSLFALMIEPLAVIRSDSTIKGIRRGESEHKMSLYADDTLLNGSEPLKTLPQILSLLGSFGKISGYKINLQKSELLPINTAARLITFDSLPFKLSKDKFKYLGIWVTNNYKHLYKANFIPLMDSIKQDLKCWRTLPISLGGRINTVKMNILPRFLYLFQCIPIFLTKSFFLLIDKLISAFIWNGKNAHIRKSILQRHREHGGLSLPNFQYYYWAANNVMLYWFKSYIEDLATGITEDVWQSILKNIHLSSICQRHRVIQFKVVHRLHWSKVKLAKFKREIDPHCDRCEVEPRTLYHMFWLCPKLEDFLEVYI